MESAALGELLPEMGNINMLRETQVSCSVVQVWCLFTRNKDHILTNLPAPPHLIRTPHYSKNTMSPTLLHITRVHSLPLDSSPPRPVLRSIINNKVGDRSIKSGWLSIMKSWKTSTGIWYCMFLLFISTGAAETLPRLQGSTLQISRALIASEKELSWEEAVLQQQANDHSRLHYLSSLLVRKAAAAPVASGRQIFHSTTYIVKAGLGSPPQSVFLGLDTSSDVAWVPSTRCTGCASKASLFNFSASSSYRQVPCNAGQCKEVHYTFQVANSSCKARSCGFQLTYGSSSMEINLARDTLTLATDPMPNYIFGCVENVAGKSIPSQGLLGLGRGRLSLLSQSRRLYRSTFSYCLPNFSSRNFSGSLRLGPIGQPKNIKTTPLTQSPRRSSFYYVNLIAIRVGRRIIDIPGEALAFNKTSGSGTIFDSGTVYTRLVATAYTRVRDQIRRRIGITNITSLGGFDTCYQEPVTHKAPTMTLMFTGMNVTLPRQNMFIQSNSSGATCLAMAASPVGVNSGLNIIASMQQQNHRVLFDLPNSRLGVAREQCS